MKKNNQNEIDIVRIAQLARLDLSEEEIPRLKKELSSIVNYVDQLASVDIDLDQVTPTSHVVPMTNVMRLDEVGQTMEQSEVLANAPEILDEEYIKVPPVISAEDRN